MFLISWIVAPSIIMRRLFEARGPRHRDFGYVAHSTCQVQITEDVEIDAQSGHKHTPKRTTKATQIPNRNEGGNHGTDPDDTIRQPSSLNLVNHCPSSEPSS